ncbi:hypothetical protein SHKM778_33340 [Streptomyces sp. KM77-8]|uniref:Uncharacterized protein n=1 Tax=Streptomyces haneummycinicus TaxID=3074435 RepID=A0AAT9HHP8_9ACTN
MGEAADEPGGPRRGAARRAQQRPGQRPEDVQTGVGAGARSGEKPDDPVRPAPYEGEFPAVRQAGSASSKASAPATHAGRSRSITVRPAA